ncbi:YbdD/YjiX family protein [Nocardia jejuensis]|uniref:YbdD/YjiX family protein n=1 Tax=Nocardia jejuensis TaxID=328049 RepID=UPI0009FFAA1E|nr:YbdD/YjiX family protein [Nocardia jejuensis]
MTDPTVPPTAGALRSAGRAVLRVIRAVIWWFDSILGGNDYARYVDHLTLHHPGCDIPTERDYWRDRHDAAARNPANRCC